MIYDGINIESIFGLIGRWQNMHSTHNFLSSTHRILARFIREKNAQYMRLCVRVCVCVHARRSYRFVSSPLYSSRTLNTWAHNSIQIELLTLSLSLHVKMLITLWFVYKIVNIGCFYYSFVVHIYLCKIDSKVLFCSFHLFFLLYIYYWQN